MAAYMIVMCKIKDRERFVAEYAIPTAKLAAKLGGEYVVRSPNLTCLEGDIDEATSVVISKWPSRVALDEMWNSQEYQQLKEKRRAFSEVQIVVTEDNSV
ncbi:hypothetical protein HY29_03620 [Hyphomonas beringensis]|uniref:DUF1330 domain-containing protein n=1 Tax=Hyphomonas beringensis TaxID=1280946 RepID=A0A062U9P6_9PROT|nr:DUF1330 domain-containing protein [Hyphomonas beringensis]KCZ53319.1 hypothetical protein HY29_03620 [Hyphomonas beringensis]